MLYAEPDERPEDIACRWRDCLQDRALVRTKDEAIADGLFGPVCERVRPMLGDVVVQAAGAVTPRRFAVRKETRPPTCRACMAPKQHWKWIFPA